MKVQCDVCERNKAAVMCCADEAVLCSDCDTRVHAANKLAIKHQRISLITPSEAPRCDICQDKSGYFFCLEDRALLCRECDLSIHSANSLSSKHQRFLLPGTRVALEAIAVTETQDSPPDEVPQYSSPRQSSESQFSQFEARDSNNMSPSRVMGRAPPAMDVKPVAPSRHPYFAPQFNNPAYPARLQGGQGNNFEPSRMQGMMGAPPNAQGHQNGYGQQNPGTLRRSSITEFLTEGVPGWRMDELLNLGEIADGYNASDCTSSKCDAAYLGDFDWTAGFDIFDDQVYGDGQHEVPQMPSPPTASGLSRGTKVDGAVKGNLKQESAVVPDYDNLFVVPDLGLQNSPPPLSPPSTKRRRRNVC